MLLGRAQQFINNNQRSRTTVWSFGSGGMAIMDLALFPHVGSVCHPTHTHLISHDLARSIIKRHYNMHAFRTKSNRAYWTTEAWRYRVIISTQRLNRITYNQCIWIDKLLQQQFPEHHHRNSGVASFREKKKNSGVARDDIKEVVDFILVKHSNLSWADLATDRVISLSLAFSLWCSGRRISSLPLAVFPLALALT